MRISISYSHPEEDVLEIVFFRGETLLHNIFYDIEGLNEDELVELKQEAVAKFCVLFPEISKKDIMKGFSTVDPLMQKLYKEAFNPRNAGRKRGKKIKPATVDYHRRILPEFVPLLDEYLDELNQKNKSKE